MRRLVVRRLKPFVDRRGSLSETDAERRWTSDFGLGFLGALISLTARHAAREIDDEAFGRLQVEGWAELTGLDGTTVGTRIAILSASEDLEFAAGCRAALRFGAALSGVWPEGGEDQVDERGFPLPPTPGSDAADPARMPDLVRLWERLLNRQPEG